MTREEAIKIVRNIYQTDAEKEALATLIPELAESEDERIIRTLQDYVKNRNWPLNGPTQDEVLAYLEKQKECLADNNKTSTDEDERIRKEINILYSDIDACITELLKARTDKDSESEGKALFKMEGLMVATLQDLSCIEDYLEKQKEPENTSASTMAPSCWQKEQKPKAKAKSPLSPHELYDAKIEGISQGRQDVLDHPEQFGLQKPAEWSKEERIILDSIIDDYEKAAKSFCGYAGKIWFLKAIRDGEITFQSQQKLDASKLENFDPVDVLNRIKTEWPMAWEKVVGKQEWSEKEIGHLYTIARYKRPFFRDDKGRGYSTTEQDEEVAWNALRAWCEKKGISLYDLYPKAEWSEEDEDMLNSCISSIEEAKENRYAYKETDGDTSYDHEIAWLKSLRPLGNHPRSRWRR